MKLINSIKFKKVRPKKCDPQQQNLPNNIFIEILLKQVRQKKCDPQRQNLPNNIFIELLLKPEPSHDLAAVRLVKMLR